MHFDFKYYVDDLLNSFAKKCYPSSVNPLNEAIQYALLGPGKRVRAQLALMVCHVLDKPILRSHQAALALEMMHTYSLVHDDLPCLDNDELRRGRPTVHVCFNEATALLAADALLTDAFRVLSDARFIGIEDSVLDAQQSLNLVRRLSTAGGSSGMVGGQMLDVHWTAKSGGTISDLSTIHLNKTAKLIGAAMAMGAISAGEATPDVDRWQQCGEHIGMSFQIIDDLLDGEQSTGKSQGKDAAQGKLTYVTLLGKDEAKRRGDHHTEAALSLLKSYGDRATILKDFIVRLLTRKV